jgi:capsular polysaccharide biosynthesis protein
MMKEEQLDFAHFFQIIFRRMWLIILFTLAAVLASAYISYYVLTPVYQAEVDILINVQPTKDNPALTSSIDESLKLVTTYQDIVQSPVILQEAQSKLNSEGYDIRIDEDDISVGRTTESQVFELLVEDEDAMKATLIANSIAESFDSNIQNLWNNKAKNIKILNKAAVDSDPVSPQPILIINITLFISFIVSIWFTLLIDTIKKRRKSV